MTPSHLLVGRRLLSLPDHLTYLEPEDDKDFELATEAFQRRAKHLNSVLNHFWRRWSREYLLELRDTHRQRNTEKSQKSMETGDMVLVHDPDHPRGFWKLAKVESLITGKDGVVRGAVLKVGSKSGPPTTLQRLLQLLYPLEISSESPTTNVTIHESSEPQTTSSKARELEQEPSVSPRSRREAAIQGRRLVRQWCTSENVIDHN